MAEPVDLADIKRHLVLELDDASEDGYLGSMIIAARRACELRTRRTIVGEDRLLVLPRFPAQEPILLGWLVPNSPATPVSGHADIIMGGGTVTSVTVNYYAPDGSDTELGSGSYHRALEGIPAALRPISAWPATQDRPDAVRIAYSLAPLDRGELEIVRHAIRLIVGHWYANREAVSADGRAGTAEMPLAVTWLLDPLRQFASD